MGVKASWQGKQPDEAGHEFLDGVPARSLDDAEYDGLTAEQRAAVRKSGLYDVKPDGKKGGD